MTSASTSTSPTVLVPGGPNAIAMTMAVMGDEWTLWIVELAICTGITRYNDWLRSGPISSSVLTTRLTNLVEARILHRVRYAPNSDRYDYVLTARGRQLWPILLTLRAWERRWGNGSGSNRARHLTCGEAFEPVLICAPCGRPAAAEQVRGRFGPSWSWQRSVPPAATRRRARTRDRAVPSAGEATEIIGNRWSAAMLTSAFFGATRFGEFERRMGAPPTIIADRLRRFRELNLFDAVPNPSRPDWVTYHLTPKGRGFFPVLAEALEWGQRWFCAPEGDAVEQEHLACGQDFHPRLICDQCTQPVRGSHIAWSGATP